MMTLALGFHCTDGLVLVTIPEYRNRHGRSI